MTESAFRPATLTDYLPWLRRWLRAGHKPTHYCDYPFDRWTWLVAQRDFTTGDERGSAAVQIIVPAGVEHLGGGRGHNRLYFMDMSMNPWIVPVFDAPEFLALPGVKRFVQAERARKEAWEAEREASLAADRARAAVSDIGRFLGRQP